VIDAACFSCPLEDCNPRMKGCLLPPSGRGGGGRPRRYADMTPEQKERRREYMRGYMKDYMPEYRANKATAEEGGKTACS
jgi:hypothetical protein